MSNTCSTSSKCSDTNSGEVKKKVYKDDDEYHGKLYIRIYYIQNHWHFALTLS